MRNVDAKQTAVNFCIAWFQERDLKQAANYLCEDVQFIGTSEKEFANGKDEMMNYILEDIKEISEPFHVKLEFIYDRQLSDTVYTLSAQFTLKNSVYAWHLNGFFVMRKDNEEWLICNLHF